MTRKHFIALAEVVRSLKGTRHEFSESQIYTISGFLREYGENFDRERWLDYVQNGPKKSRR